MQIRDYRDPRWPGALRDFYQTAIGQDLLGSLQNKLDEYLPSLFGYHAVQLGNITKQHDLLQVSAIRHRVGIDMDDSAPSLRAHAGSLPLQTDSIDLAFLAHSLDFAVDPYQVLREVERVVIPEGHVLILGFNPFSCFGLWKALIGWRGYVPWCGRFYLATRVADWLSLLGFELRSRFYFGFRPPTVRPKLRERLAFLETVGSRGLPTLGGAYLLLAKKHVAAVTPIRPRWGARRTLFPTKLTDPATRNGFDGGSG